MKKIIFFYLLNYQIEMASALLGIGYLACVSALHFKILEETSIHCDITVRKIIKLINRLFI